MTTPINSPSSGAERDERKNSSRSNLFELLEDVTESSVFSELHNEAELLKKLKKNPNEFADTIRSEMRERFLRTPRDYEGFGEKDIKELSNETILDKLRFALLETKTAQEKIRAKVLSMYNDSNFDEDTPNGRWNIEKLQEWSENQNVKDIEKYLRSPALLKKILKRECFSNLDTFIEKNMTAFIKELAIPESQLSSDDIAALRALQIWQPEIWTASWSLQGDIRRVLGLVERSSLGSTEKMRIKREIIRDYLPSITPALLVSLWILTESEAKKNVKTWLEKLLGEEYFEEGSNDEQRERNIFLENAYKKGWYIEIPTKEYLENDAFVEKLFEKSLKSTTPLTENIEVQIRDMVSEVADVKHNIDGTEIGPDKNGNWHENFLKEIGKLQSPRGGSKVKNSQDLRAWSYIRVVQWGKYGYYRVVETDVELSQISDFKDTAGLPVKMRGLRLEDWTAGSGMVSPGWQGIPMTKSYGETYTLFSGPADEIEILSESDIAERRSEDYQWIDKIETVVPEDTLGISSLEDLKEKLWWIPQAGFIYSALDPEDKDNFYIEIEKINTNSGTIRMTDGVKWGDVSFSKFYEVAKNFNFKPVVKPENDEDIGKLLGWLWGLAGISVKDGKLKKAPEGSSKEEQWVQHMMNEDGEWITIESISKDGVKFRSGKIKDWGDKVGKVNIGGFKGKERSMSLVQFLSVLESQQYKPYINPNSKITEDAEDHMPHTHGSFFGKIMNWMSYNDLKKWFDLYVHAWEHKMEKNSKFQAAKFANNYLKHFMPESVGYQLRSEAYAAQNEAMEGILKMLEDQMSGKEARLYVRHKILLNDDAKFEEVLAWLLYISKKTWQLYPEELSDLRNSEIWFYKLAVTQGYMSKSARAALKAKCIDKTDKGAMSKDAISEMDIIERQLKLYEGQGKRIPPNIAPKFPGALNEGKKSNFEKGELEVNQRTNIKQMNKYALSKWNVGEWWKVMGCIDRLHTKNGSPVDLNAMPFTILMSNAPEFMGSELRKTLHGEWNGNRATHAFKFGNELSYVQTYRDSVMLAAKEIDRRNGTSAAVALKKIEEKRKHIGDEAHGGESDAPQKEWVNSIFDFWMEYGEKLQPILQLSDVYFHAEAERNSTAKAYKNRFTEQSTMQNGNLITGGEIYKNANVGEGNMDPNHTPFAFTNLVNASFSAIYPQNGKMGTSANNASAYTKIFKPGVIGSLEKLKNLTQQDIPPGMSLEKVQKARFREMYAAIIYYLRSKSTNPPEIMIWWEWKGVKFGKMDYIQDLEAFGFDLKSSDFRYSSTKPAGAEEKTSWWWPNDFEMDSIDEVRCNEMYENFKRSSGLIVSSTWAQAASIVWGQRGSQISW
jgi:hypothetical protein